MVCIKISKELQGYNLAMDEMLRLVEGRKKTTSEDILWLLQHGDVYTTGANAVADVKTLPNQQNVSIIQSNRGGNITYHGPGQQIGYIIMDLNKKYGFLNLRQFIVNIEQLVIDVLRYYNIDGERVISKPGVWTHHGGILKKISSIGIKIHKGISSHGFALNVKPNMSRFDAINPCGLSDCVMVSMADFDLNVDENELLDVVIVNFKRIFSYGD